MSSEPEEMSLESGAESGAEVDVESGEESGAESGEEPGAEPGEESGGEAGDESGAESGSDSDSDSGRSDVSLGLPPVPEGWNDSCRAFLQAFMSRVTMTFEEGQRVVAAIMTAEAKLSGHNRASVRPESITLEDFEALVFLTREVLLPIDFDIRNMEDQKTKDRIWGLVNVQSDVETQEATYFTPDELAFVKRLLDAMFDTYNSPRMELMAITEQQALKLARPAGSRPSQADNEDSGEVHEEQEAEEEEREGSREVDDDDPEAMQKAATKVLKHSEVLAMLESLVGEKWLEKSREGFYSLAPRSLMELKHWLKLSYNDPDSDDYWQPIKFCEACKDLITYGQRCAKVDCSVRLHDICQDPYWRTRREKVCPKCQTPWDGKHFVGERAVTKTEAYQKARRNGGAGRRGDVVDSIIAQEQALEEEGGTEVDFDSEMEE